MIRRCSGKTTARPHFAGEYLYRDELAVHKAWPLYRAGINEVLSLSWEPHLDYDALNIAQAAATEALQAPDNPWVRRETLVRYAVNLSLRHHASARTTADLRDTLAQVRQALLQPEGFATVVQRAIALRIEADLPSLAEIERMLTIAEALPGDHPERLSYSALAALRELQDGINPSGGLFDTTTQLEAVRTRYPVLAPPAPSCEPSWFPAAIGY